MAAGIPLMHTTREADPNHHHQGIPDILFCKQHLMMAGESDLPASAQEALELLAGQPYAVASLDAKLPDLDALELAALIRQASPHTAIVPISCCFYQEDIAITEGLADGPFMGLVAKPLKWKKSA